jgi:pyruvate dehydrogenase E2 component (dihydrolipoamide acetyltransferase)
MVNLRDLVQRARAGILRSSEIADATITITSLREQGVETCSELFFARHAA